MKKILVVTTALALMVGTSAFAQGEHKEQGGHAPPPAHASPPPPPHAQAGPPPARPAYAPPAQGGGAPGGYRPQGPQGPQGGQGYRPQGQDVYRPQGQQGAPVNRPQGQDAYRPQGQGGYHAQGPGGGGPAVRPGWGAPMAGREAPHYDARFYPHEMRFDHAYQWMGGGWRPQQGYYYRHWGYGDYLPFGWFAQSYWVSDYWDYALPVPPYGYQWVRVGPDVLLINLANGFVAETVYGVFY